MKRLILILVSLLLLIGSVIWLKFNSTLFLSRQAKALISKVHDAFARVEAAQAKLLSTTTDRDKLERMYDLDQCGREVYEHLDFSVLPEAEREAARRLAWKEIDEHDDRNQTDLKAIIPKEGWFSRSVWGDKAADGAFYVAQHAGADPELMRLALSRLEPLVASGEVDPFNFARMYDRVLVFFDHKPQRFGTQFVCRDGVLQPYDIDDSRHVDDRRRAIGLKTTASENMETVRRDSGAICK